MKLMLKRVADQEKMPDLPEGLIRFPTLEELKAPPKEEPELKIEINPPSLNVDVPKIEGEIGLPDAGIEGPKIEGEIGLPGIDIQGPKIGGEIGLPGVDVHGPIDVGIDINKPKIDIPGVGVDIQAPNIDVNLAQFGFHLLFHH